MDIRTKIINDTLTSMHQDLNDIQLKKLKDTMYIQLNKYEIQDRCTAVSTSIESPKTILKKYIATKRIEGRSENTLEQYALRVGDMLDTLDKNVEDITTYDLRFYLASYQETRKVSNRTLDNIRSCICAFFGWLYDENVISYNPTSALNPIKYEKKVRYPFSSTDMEKLRISCSSIRDRAIIEFLYSSGCRVSEVVSLNRQDVDYINRKATVVGKGNKQRTVYLDDVSVMYLDEYERSREDNQTCLFASARNNHGDLRLSASGVENMCKTLGDKAGVPNCHPHRFRRTLATNMIYRGATIQDVATILGHEDISTTAIYCTVSDKNVEHDYQRCIA